MSVLRRSMWASFIGLFIIASLYGSWLVAKERDRTFQTAKSNNELLQFINQQMTTDNATLEQLKGLLDRQIKALENHEKILKNQENISNENHKILKDHSDVMESQKNLLMEVRKAAEANEEFVKRHTKEFNDLMERLRKLLPVKPAIKSA